MRLLLSCTEIIDITWWKSCCASRGNCYHYPIPLTVLTRNAHSHAHPTFNFTPVPRNPPRFKGNVVTVIVRIEFLGELAFSDPFKTLHTILVSISQNELVRSIGQQINKGMRAEQSGAKQWKRNKRSHGCSLLGGSFGSSKSSRRHILPGKAEVDKILTLSKSVNIILREMNRNQIIEDIFMGFVYVFVCLFVCIFMYCVYVHV